MRSIASCSLFLTVQIVSALHLPALRPQSAALRTTRAVAVAETEAGDDVGEWGLEGLFDLMAESEDATDSEVCWQIGLKQLSPESTDAIADVLAQAQKQGNWLRGLEGTVLVEESATVRILAKGPQDRLDSFSDWCKSELLGQVGSSVEVTVSDPEDPEFCMLLPLTEDFALAGEGKAFDEWAARVLPKVDGDFVAGWSEEAQF